MFLKYEIFIEKNQNYFGHYDITLLICYKWLRINVYCIMITDEWLALRYILWKNALLTINF